MQLFVQLAAFILRQVLGESAASAVGFVQQRFTDQSLALPRALKKASDRAWQALGVALTGESLLDRVQRLIGRGDERGLREQIQVFLKSQQLQLPGTPDDMRRACLEEWRKVRESALLKEADPAAILKHLAGLQRFGDLAGLVETAHRTMIATADLLASDYPNLSWLPRQPTPQGPPLLAAVFAHFFRQEVVRDEELVHELLLDNLRQLTTSHGKALVEIGKALASLAENCDRVLGSLEEIDDRLADLGSQAEITHTAVLDLQATLAQVGGQQQAELAGLRGLIEKVLALLDTAGMRRGEVRPGHSLTIRCEDQKRQVRQMLDQYGALPTEQQRQAPALLNGLGKLQLGAGDFAGARKTFLEVAGTVSDSAAQAEASYNAYRAALEEQRWDDALSAIGKASALDAQRFAPFPLQRYQPRQVLGSGGFGTAFLCYDRNLDENVVIKSLHASEMERSVMDVFREVRLLRQLNHPAIIGARDGDFADPPSQSRPYVVMDYFPGSDLEIRLRRGGPLAPRDCYQVALQLARGMQAAHARGILHRDLKPDNVLVRKDARGWEVKIIDFGLALRRQTLALSRSLVSDHETILGASVAGTLRYAPPEQLGERRRDGQPVPVGPHSDVYSFGKLICHALFLTTEPRHRHWQRSREHAVWQPLLEACLEQELEHRHAGFDPVVQWLEARVEWAASESATIPQQSRLAVNATVPAAVPCGAAPGRPETASKLAGQPGVNGLAEDDLAVQLESALQGVGEAAARARHQAEELHDYAAAARTLEALPEHARDPALYLSLCAHRDRTARLENEIRQALQVGRTADLRGRVEALLELQPNRDDLHRLLGLLPSDPRPGEVLTTTQGMRFVWVPPGTFVMGSPADESCRSEDELQHRVTLSRGFWLGSQPVTQAQWVAMMERNPSSFLDPHRPVEQVSWTDCQEFCRKLGEKDGQHYRLPTEPEWEYACRAGTATAFAFGDTLSSDHANFDANFVYGSGRPGLYREQTTPVHFFQANAWGLHDMHGNVWEWCQDWYGDYPTGPVRDPQGPETGQVRVVRGGSWSCPPRYCRSAFRFWFTPNYRSRYLGFRVVLCLD